MSKSRGGAVPVVERERPSQVVYVALDNLIVAEQDRKSLGDLRELAASISAQGILQPLTVAPNGEDGKFIVVAGRRRLAAARLAGETEVPVIVRSVYSDERQRRIAMAIENLQREDLSVIEEANTYRALIATGISQHDLAAQIGKSQGHISKRIKLLDLPEDVQTRIGADSDSGGIKVADALELTKLLPWPEAMVEVLADHDDDPYESMAVIVDQAVKGLERKEKVLRAEADLTSRGVALLSQRYLGPGQAEVSTADAGDQPVYGHVRLPMTPSAHQKAHKDGHAAIVDQADGAITYVCTDPSHHADSKDEAVAEVATQFKDAPKVAGAYPGTSGRDALPGNGGMSADQRQQQAALKAFNKAFKQASEARMSAIDKAAKDRVKKGAAAGVTEFVLRQFIDTAPPFAKEGAAKLLGIAEKERAEGQGFGRYLDYEGFLEQNASENLLRLAYAVSMLIGERPFQTYIGPSRYFDQQYRTQAVRLLDHLEHVGYVVTPEERALIEGRERMPHLGRSAAGWTPGEVKPTEAEGGVEFDPEFALEVAKNLDGSESESDLRAVRDSIQSAIDAGNGEDPDQAEALTEAKGLLAKVEARLAELAGQQTLDSAIDQAVSDHNDTAAAEDLRDDEGNPAASVEAEA